MDTSVKLQDMFSYSKLPIFIVAGVFLAILLGMILARIIKKIKWKKIKKKQKPIEIKPKIVDIMKAKSDYLDQLRTLEREYQENLCTVRDAYQRMSAIIRGFVEDVTGIQVQNCTLLDIKVLNMPVLEELIEEYYSPEFARESEGDVMTSIGKTRGAIERWN